MASLLSPGAECSSKSSSAATRTSREDLLSIALRLFKDLKPAEGHSHALCGAASRQATKECAHCVLGDLLYDALGDLSERNDLVADRQRTFVGGFDPKTNTPDSTRGFGLL